MPLEDPEVSTLVQRSFERRGIRVMTNARFDAAKVEVTKDGVCLVVGPEGKPTEELRAEQMLVATGRAPNTENIGLETTKIELERGFVKVDGQMRTREPHLYAIGDVIGGLMLAHVAAHEGLIAVHQIAGDTDVRPGGLHATAAGHVLPAPDRVDRVDRTAVPGAGSPYKVGKVPFQAIGKALIDGEPEGFCKVVGNAETGDTLGVHIVGPHVTDLVTEASWALLESTPWEIGAATHPHPTLSETLGEAALAVDGSSINF